MFLLVAVFILVKFENVLYVGMSVILFPNQREAAFSVNRFWYGLSFSISFLYAIFFSVTVQLWLMVAHLVIGVFTYSILILKTMRRDQLFPCLAQKSPTPAVSSMQGYMDQV